MASKVSICNGALASIGAGTISALTEASVEARACNRFYDDIRAALLQSYPWRWAGASVVLAEVTNDKPGRWAYAHAYPNDCLKVRFVRPEYTTTPSASEFGYCTPTRYGHSFAIQGKTLYCGFSPAVLIYTKDVDDPSFFPPLFVQALTAQLASDIAMPITRDMRLRDVALQMAGRTASAAREADANEGVTSTCIDSDFVGARTGSRLAPAEGWQDG